MAIITLEELPDGAIRMLQGNVDPKAGGRYRPSEVVLVMYGPAQSDMVRTPWGLVAVKFDPQAPPGQVMLLPIGAMTAEAIPSGVVAVTGMPAAGSRSDWVKDPAKDACLRWAIGEDWLDVPLGSWGPVAYANTAGAVQIFGTDTFGVAAMKCLRAWESVGRPGAPEGTPLSAVPTAPPTGPAAAQNGSVAAEEVLPRPVYRDDPAKAPTSPTMADPPDQGRETRRVPYTPPPATKDRVW